MDRNSAIGLTLIAFLLLAYFYWFSPSPQPVDQQAAQTITQAPLSVDSVQQPVSVPDSVLKKSFGDLASAMSGTSASTVVETNDIRIAFSNKGGKIESLELKKFQSYQQKFILKNNEYLKLISPKSNSFKLTTIYQGKNLDLYNDVYYTLDQKKSGDTTVVTYTLSLSDGTSVAHIYSIPNAGYEIGYKIVSKGFENQLNSDNLTFSWTDALQLIEKDIKDARTNSTITYYTEAESFEDLSPTGSETEVISGPVKWVAIKEKFFLASIISKKKSFPSGEVSTSINELDSTVVKTAAVKLAIPKTSLADGTADFKFYIGPNDYQIIGNVTDKFAKNVYLGWPPVYWINKFVIFPVFHFLTLHIGSFGLIIIILTILLKLVLLPLSYKSYLSMAKMKVLKPELDEIKERVGDDMAKVQQEQMKLYQQVGVNPLSGCVPVLLQMPLIFAMFYLFPASIELRQQPLLWAEDLSTYDSLISFSFAIPFLGNHVSLFTLIMTITTLISIWQNSQMTSVQGPMKSMQYIMPVVFFFFLNSFSAGLTFYYTTSTLLTFIQQAVIKRYVDEDKLRTLMEENKKKNAAGTGKKSKFMSRLEDAMKASEEARRKADESKKKK